MPEKIPSMKRLFHTTFTWAWALMLMLLPITTLPILLHVFGWVTVAPASIIPLVWLVIWLIYYLLRKGDLPRESIPFLAFVSVAVFSSAVAFFREFPTFKAHDLLDTEISSLLTLGIGSAFYLVGIAWLSSRPKELDKSLRIINYTGLVMLAWSSIQAVYALFFNSQYPEIMLEIQSIFNTRGFFHGRVTGFAFEPSWLAHQLNLFFLPFWLASTIKGSSVHRFRIWKLTFENLLLVAGIAMILLSSRIGTVAILLVIIFLGIRLHLWGLNKVYKAFDRHLKVKPGLLKFTARVGILSMLLSALVFLYILALFGLVFTLANFDPRIARLFDLEGLKLNITSPYELFNQLVFAERYVYWVTGWRIFNDYPILGVGLGNAGLYFLTHLPSYGWVLAEVMESVYRLPAIMNIKSFWVRILAETGLAGFATFMSWYAVLWQTSRFLELHKQKLMSMLGLAGQLVLVAFIAEGFSIDTFALPYLWLALGFVSAAGMVARQSISEPAQNVLPAGGDQP